MNMLNLIKPGPTESVRKMKKTLFTFFIVLLVLTSTAGAQKVNLTNSSSETFWPAVAVNKDGVIMAVYTEDVGTFDIFFTLSFDGGNTWTTPARTFSADYFIKSVALDADIYGNFHMAYADGYGSAEREIYHRVYSGGWQAKQQVSFSVDNSNWCSISCDGNDVHIAWYQEHGWPRNKPFIALKSKNIGGGWPSNPVDASRDPSNGAIYTGIKALNGNLYLIYQVQQYSGDTLLDVTQNVYNFLALRKGL